MEQLDRGRGEMRIQHLDKFAFDSTHGEATVNIAIAPLVSREMEQIGRLVIFDDITARAELERRLGAGRQAFKHRSSGRAAWLTK